MLKHFFLSFCVLSISFIAYHTTIEGFDYIDAPVLHITNCEKNGEISNPSFIITSDLSYDTIWWQLSSSCDFPTNLTIEKICPLIECFILSENEKLVLNEGQEFYYFRAKGCFNGFWGDWSEIFTFARDESTTKKNLLNDVNQHLCKSINLFDPPSSAYERNPFVDADIWNMLLPYFIPEDDPVKVSLDKIFHKKRVLNSRKSMIESGFSLLSKPTDKVIVARHPYLKGYLVKAYTDQMAAPDWFWWKKRIDGVKAIEEKINQSGYQTIMKTPKKWIYPLPSYPTPLHGVPYHKNFILVVEELDILKKKHNLKAYKKKMTPQILDAFYIMLMDLRLIDSIYADNTPFCKDGRLAFIDTEHSSDNTRPVPITTVAKYLSTEMYSYWEQLIIHGGPPRSF